MKSPNEIKLFAEKTYTKFLVSYLIGDSFFPLKIPNKKVNLSFTERLEAEKKLSDNSKEKKGYGYIIEYKEINKRTEGKQKNIDKISFQNQNNYLKFINKEADFELFAELINKILNQFSNLSDWLRKNVTKINQNKDNWDNLLKVCKYFLIKHIPDSKLYIRELPIEIHTKFIENNKTILNSLLSELLPENKINKEITGITNNNFEKRFFLNYDKTLIRLRILDESLYINNLSDISIQPDEFFKLNIECKNVFIAENLMNVLTFPKIKDSIVIWGKGNRVNVIKSAKWLAGKKIYYWGDIDTWGLHILSSLRKHFKNVVSILMTKAIFEKYLKFTVKEKKSNITLPKNLTPNEIELFNFLLSLLDKGNENRLEQEHIPQNEILNVLMLL